MNVWIHQRFHAALFCCSCAVTTSRSQKEARGGCCSWKVRMKYTWFRPHGELSAAICNLCVCVCGSGGWYCFDSQTCESRYETMRRLMSSTKWPLTRTGTGPTVCACRIHFYTLPSLSGCSFTNSSQFLLLFRGCPNWHMALLLFLSIIMKCPWKLTVVKLH